MVRRSETLEETVERVLRSGGGGLTTVAETGHVIRQELDPLRSRAVGKVFSLAALGGGVRQMTLTDSEVLEAGARARIGDRRGLVNLLDHSDSRVQLLQILGSALQSVRGEDGALRQELVGRLRSEVGLLTSEDVPATMRVELAGTLYAVDPGSGLSLLQRTADSRNPSVRVETALARIRTRAGIERLREELGTRPRTADLDDGERLADMLERGVCAIGSRTAEGLSSVLASIDDEGSHFRLTAAWISLNGEDVEAPRIAYGALRRAISSKEYAPDAAFYSGLAHALGHRSGDQEGLLATLIATQETTWSGERPRSSALRVGLRIARQLELDGQVAEADEKRADLYWRFVDGDNERALPLCVVEQLECAAVFLRELGSLTGEDIDQLRSLCSDAVKSRFGQVQRDAANQFEIIRRTLGELIYTSSELVQFVISGLNTLERRYEAIVYVIRELSGRATGLDLAVDFLCQLPEGRTRRDVGAVLADSLRQDSGRRQLFSLVARTKLAGLLDGTRGYAPLKQFLADTDSDGADGDRWRDQLLDEIDSLESEAARSLCLSLLSRVDDLGSAWASELVSLLGQNSDSPRRDRREHGYDLLLAVAVDALVGIAFHGGDIRSRYHVVEQYIRAIHSLTRRSRAWARWSLALHRSGNEADSKRVLDTYLLPDLRAALRSSLIESSHVWIIGAAIGAHRDDDVSGWGFTLNREVAEALRWGAFLYATLRDDPEFDSDVASASSLSVPYAQCEKIIAYAACTEIDSVCWQMVQVLGDVASGPDREVTINEAAVLAQLVEQLAADRLPHPHGIQHWGYRILVLAEAARDPAFSAEGVGGASGPCYRYTKYCRSGVRLK